MRKLKLESLEVESFETASSPDRNRGTVEGHEDERTKTCPMESYCYSCYWTATCPSIEICADTEYLDCTYTYKMETCDTCSYSCGSVC